MLPILEGVIARRVLLNFRADPLIVQKLLPGAFEAEQCAGSAIVGVCLIRLEGLRGRGFPWWAGMASENMAHRVAVTYRTSRGQQRAVFIWRRETDQRLVKMFGGRLFPGVHQLARFQVKDEGESVSMTVQSADGKTDVCFSATTNQNWQPTPAFRCLEEASTFFQGGDCGFSYSLNRKSVEGMQLKIKRWSLTPLSVQLKEAAFYFDPARFPKGSIEFDHGLMMRSIPHEWHEIQECPALHG